MNEFNNKEGFFFNLQITVLKSYRNHMALERNFLYIKNKLILGCRLK